MNKHNCHTYNAYLYQSVLPKPARISVTHHVVLSYTLPHTRGVR